jgi:hypothetical protein
VIVTVAVWTMVVLLGAFAAAGVWMLVVGLRVNAIGAEGLTVRERVARYVGPVGPRQALLDPPKRVLVELVAASCGFPGLGWLVSGRVAVGLALLVVGPACVWGFFPVALALAGRLYDGPYTATAYLPALGAASAAALAVVEFRARRVARGPA